MPTVTSSTAAAANASPATARLNADFDLFLKLLTTQMQNQDPLDPMDTAEYTQQLVQYSQVEQSIEQNTTLKSILAALGTQDLSQASSLIGQGVQVDSAASTLGVAPAQWHWSATRETGNLTATIRDASGRTVDTHTVEGGLTGDIAWDGTLSSGGTAPAGNYTLELAATDSAGNAIPVTVRGAGVVTGVEMADGTVVAIVGGNRVPLTSLVSIGG